MERARKAGARGSLSRALVMETALAMLDEGGLESLSMRNLGKRLGVEAMSLYNHVAGKDDVVEGALELAVAEIALPEPGEPWREAMRRRAASARSAFERHPWAAALVDSRTGASPARLKYYDAILGALTGAGFPLAEAAMAFSALDSFVYGYGLQRRNAAAPGEDGPRKRARAFRDEMPAEAYPHVARMAELAAERGYDPEADFEYGLSLLLDGLERRLPAKGPQRGETRKEG